MRCSRIAVGMLALIAVLALVRSSSGQTPAGKAPAKAKGRAAAATSKPPATLAQLMKGTLYPASNIIFFAQSENPAEVRPAKDPATATDPLASAYGKWEAVENSALVLVEVASLLNVPGRTCSNGRPVPMNNPDWPKFVQGLREAGLKAYKAAQSKNQDQILDAADVMTTACSNCHDKYREKPTLAERCR